MRTSQDRDRVCAVELAAEVREFARKLEEWLLNAHPRDERKCEVESRVVAEAMPGAPGVWAPAIFVYEGSRIVKTVAPVAWGNYKSRRAAQRQADYRRAEYLGTCVGAPPARLEEW